MKIRYAKMTDAEELSRNAINLARESEDMDLDYTQVIQGIQKVIANKEKGFYIVVEEEQEIVGQLMITFEWSDWRNTDIWWIQSVFVKKKWRKKGLMKKMVGEIHHLASKNNVSTLRLYVHNDNREAIHAYEKIGMTKAPYQIYHQNVPLCTNTPTHDVPKTS